MTLWQASLHTCQLVGDIYPLINAPTLIGISSSFFNFIFYFFTLCIQLFLKYFFRLAFIFLQRTGCAGCFSGQGCVLKTWQFLEGRLRSSFFDVFPTFLMLLCYPRQHRSHLMLYPGDSKGKFNKFFFSCSHVKILSGVHRNYNAILSFGNLNFNHHLYYSYLYANTVLNKEIATL